MTQIKKSRNESVLLLGTGATSLPILEALKDLGFKVGVIGNRASDICHKLSDFSHFKDYTDYESVLSIYQKHNYKYVVPSCSDMSYEIAAKLARKKGLTGFDDMNIINIITNKYAFRDHLKKCNLDYPKFFYPNESDKEKLNGLKLPVIVKPLKADTGKGIQVVNEEKKLSDAIKTAKSVSRDNKCLIEEYKPGTLHSISCFIKKTKIQKAFIVDEFCTDYPYAVNESNYPSQLPDKIINKAISDVQKFISSLKLIDGLLHVQFILYKNNIFLVESMRRMPGDFYGKLIELSNGCSYYKSYVCSFTESESSSDIANIEKNERLIVRQTITSPIPKVMTSISFNCSGKIIELFTFAKNGQDLNKFPFDKQGVAFFEYNNPIEFKSEIGQLVKRNYA